MAEETTVDLIIPIFNEEDALPALVDELQATLPGIEGYIFSVILVDDHSSDGTPRLLKEICAKDKPFHYLRLASNSGSHMAILAGLAESRGDCAIFLAADLQDPPSLIPQMLESWRGGHQVVWAARETREGASLLERMLSRAFWALSKKLSGLDLPAQGVDFALLDRRVIVPLLQSASSDFSIAGEIVRLGFSQTCLLFPKADRRHGKSKWTLEKKLKAFADAFVSFSYAPMRLMSYIGLFFSTLGFIYAVFIISMKLIAGVGMLGWPSLMVVVLTVGGIQMTMLGVMGEYLWRTLEVSRRRPLYVIEERSGDQDAG